MEHQEKDYQEWQHYPSGLFLKLPYNILQHNALKLFKLLFRRVILKLLSWVKLGVFAEQTTSIRT